jgi:hypothetical protein
LALPAMDPFNVSLTTWTPSYIFDPPLVSPAQEHVVVPEWSTDYQLVSCSPTSGNQTILIEMCHAAGVGVIAGQSKVFTLNLY